MKRIFSRDLLLLLLGHVALLFAAFIEIWARGYAEFTLTLFVAGLFAMALALLAFFLKKRWLFFLPTILLLTGAVLLILFPSYVSFTGFVFGGLLLVGETLSLLFAAKKEKTVS